MGRSDERGMSGLVPEVSLAARAGSLGATSLQTPYRLQNVARQGLPLEGMQSSPSSMIL